MYCRYCGTKLGLRFKENEGLVPYCENCGKFVFPFFPIAVSMASLQAVLALREALYCAHSSWAYAYSKGNW